MQQVAPVGVPSDAPRGGSGESSRAVVPTTDRLRTLADWLDAHPSAIVHQVSFIDAGHDGSGVADVNCYAHSVAEMDALALAIEPAGWELVAREKSVEMVRMIAPGVRFRFFMARWQDDEAAGEA